MSGFGRAPAHVSEADARASLLPTTAPVPARETSSPDVDRRDEDAPLLTRDPAPGRRSEKSGPLAVLRAVSASSIVVVGGAVASLAAVILMGYSPFGTSGARDQLGVESTARALQHQVVVAFQSVGYVNYHATIRLFRAAFPDKDIILVDAGDANADVDNRHVFARSSAEGLPVDFVVEGPNVHRWVDGPNACRWTVGNTVTAGWLQMIGEPQYVYQDDLWCPHARAPTVRLDTATTNLRAYDEAHTTFLWSPYSQHHLISYLPKFADRKIRHMKTQPFDRPYFAAYMSSDCKSFRDDMFRALESAGRNTGRVRGGAAHALGKCSHNHEWAHGVAYPPMSLYSPYEEYRFVMAFENSAERGYVTEKLGAALLSGSVPVYWGDSDAAERVFNPRSYVDARKFWAENGSRAAANDIGRATGEDFAKLARYLTEIDSDRELYESYLLEDVRAIPEDTETADKALPYPYPSARLQPHWEAEKRPRVRQAVLRLRNQYEDGRQRRKHNIHLGAGRPGRMYTSINWRKDAKDAGSARRAYEEPMPVEKLIVPALDAPDERHGKEVEFPRRGKAEVLSLTKEREKETAPMKKRAPVLSRPEKDAVKHSSPGGKKRRAAKTSSVHAERSSMGESEEDTPAVETEARRAKTEEHPDSKAPVIEAERDDAEPRDKQMRHVAVEVDYGIFEHVTISSERLVEERRRARAEARAVEKEHDREKKAKTKTKTKRAVDEEEEADAAEKNQQAELGKVPEKSSKREEMKEPSTYSSVQPSIRPQEMYDIEFEDYALEEGAAKEEFVTEAPREMVEVDYGIFEHVDATATELDESPVEEKKKHHAEEHHAAEKHHAHKSHAQKQKHIDEAEVSSVGSDDAIANDDAQKLVEVDYGVFEHVDLDAFEIKQYRADEAVKEIAAPVDQVEKNPEKVVDPVKKIPKKVVAPVDQVVAPVEDIVAPAAKQLPLVATQGEPRRLDERAAPSEANSNLGDDEPAQNPPLLVDDSEPSTVESRATASSAAPAVRVPFDDVPTIMGGWNLYAGVPRPEPETPRPAFQARDPHEITEIRGGWNAARGESRDFDSAIGEASDASGAMGSAETDEADAAAEPAKRSSDLVRVFEKGTKAEAAKAAKRLTEMPEFHMEKGDMLAGVFDILGNGAA